MSKQRSTLIASKEGTDYDPINPDHYRKYPIEIIDMMVSIFGKEATRTHCLMTAFKYRMRLGHKDGIEQEMAKEKWYLDKANELL